VVATHSIGDSGCAIFAIDINDSPRYSADNFEAKNNARKNVQQCLKSPAVSGKGINAYQVATFKGWARDCLGNDIKINSALFTDAGDRPCRFVRQQVC